MIIKVLTYLAVFIVSGLFLTVYAAPDGNKLVKTEFISEYNSIKPGMKFKIGITISSEKHWHTYWVNPGDAGLPTTIDFQLPKGVKIGEAIWETPEKISFAGMANYGYEGSNILTFPVEISDDFSETLLKISAEVKWLVCKEECIPGSRKISIEIPVSLQPEKNDINTSAFEKSQTKHYLDNNDLNYLVKKNGDEGILLEIHLPDYLKDIKKLEFYPLVQGTFDNGVNQNYQINGNVATLRLLYDKYRESDPKEISGILVADIPMFVELPNKAVKIKVDIK